MHAAIVDPVIQRIAQNPLLVRWTRRTNGRSVRRLLGIGFLISLAAVLLSLLVAAVDAEYAGATETALLLLGISIIATPPFIAYSAAILTSQELHNVDYPLLCITTLSNAQIVEGFVFSVLYRSRARLMILVGFLPVMLFMTAVVTSHARYDLCVQRSAYQTQQAASCDVEAPTGADMLNIAEVYALLLTNTAGLSLFAAALGVCCVVWLRNVSLASGAAVFTIIGLYVYVFLDVLFGGRLFFSLPLREMTLLLPAEVVAALALLLLAQPRARKTP